MSKCKHINNDGLCTLHSEPFYKEPCHEGPCPDYAVFTNADKIRSMTDAELAEYLCCVENADSYAFEWLYWLKQEVDDGD